MEHDRATRVRPVWGRTALWFFLGTVLLTYVGVGSNTIPGGGWMLCLIVAITGGLALAITSFVKGEPRGPAIAAIILASALPALVFFGMFIFFTFFYMS